MTDGNRAILREMMGLAVVAVPVAIAASLAVGYALLLVGALDGFGRLVAMALIVPILCTLPLLGWLGAERLAHRDTRRTLSTMQSRDQVTGLLNGAALSSMVDGMVDRRRAARNGGAFLIIDASALNSVNRAYGFQWRDEALRHVAGALRGAIRATDLAARVGGDSFGVFLAGAGADEAHRVGERIRAAVADSYFAPTGVQELLHVTVAGVVFDHTPTLQELYVEAARTLEAGRPASEITLRRLPAAEEADPAS